MVNVLHQALNHNHISGRVPHVQNQNDYPRPTPTHLYKVINSLSIIRTTATSGATAVVKSMGRPASEPNEWTTTTKTEVFFWCDGNPIRVVPLLKPTLMIHGINVKHTIHLHPSAINGLYIVENINGDWVII